MKKNILVLSALLLLTVTSNAIMTIKQNGKITKYPAGSVIRVNAATDITVEYNGTTIVIPKNTKVILREEMVSGERTVIIRGEDISGVKIGDLSLSARGAVAFSFNPDTKKIEVQAGAVLITDPKGEPVLVYKGDSFKQGKTKSSSSQQEEETLTQEEQQQLNPGPKTDDSDKYQQSSKNIEEEKVLSRSVPL